MRNTGRGFEALLAFWHQRYKAQGAAYIIKTEPPVRVLSSVVKGEFRAKWRGQGPPDFVGFLASGRGFVSDAKDVTGSKPWHPSSLKDHQARALREAHRMGAASGVLIRFDGDGWWLPWSALDLIWDEKRRPTFPRSRLEEHAKRFDLDPNGPGWLGVVGE